MPCLTAPTNRNPLFERPLLLLLSNEGAVHKQKSVPCLTAPTNRNPLFERPLLLLLSNEGCVQTKKCAVFHNRAHSLFPTGNNGLENSILQIYISKIAFCKFFCIFFSNDVLKCGKRSLSWVWQRVNKVSIVNSLVE